MSAQPTDHTHTHPDPSQMASTAPVVDNSPAAMAAIHPELVSESDPLGLQDYPPFDGRQLGLPQNFTLYSYTKLKGCGCKIPRVDLLRLLEGVGSGIGMDSSVVESKKYPGLFLVSTTDFFFPLVEDPEAMGRIAACNVLSDMYAMGVVDVDNVLMLLASSEDMAKDQAEIVTAAMIKGFDAQVREAGSAVTGGQSVRNPWPLIGGVAQSMCKASDFIMPVNAQAGDLIILTKPLGNQVAGNAKQWMWDPEKWSKYASYTTERTVRRAFAHASRNMQRLNKVAAQLMHKHNAHAATDVTGFGIMGHLDAMCKNQVRDVSMELHTLPILAGMAQLSKATNFKLLQGYSAESSGGLMICLSPEDAHAYMKEIEEIEGFPAWVVGRVVEGGGRTVRMVDDVKVIDV